MRMGDAVKIRAEAAETRAALHPTLSEVFAGVRYENARLQPLIAAYQECFEQLVAILEIGKRDLTNPKYDSYFTKENLARLEALAKDVK